MIATSRPRCPTPCRRASAPTTAGATAPSAQPSRRGLRPIAPPMPPLAPVTRTRQRWSCMNRWYPWRGSGRPAALGRLRVLGVVPRSTEPSWRRSAVNAGRAMAAVACASPDKERSKLFDRPGSEPALVSDPAWFGALKPTPVRRPEHDSGRYGDSAVRRIAGPRPEEVHRAPRFAARAQRGSIPGATSLAIRSICCRSPPIGQR